MTATVTSDMTKGFCFAEADGTSQCVFIHVSQVKGERYLHAGDRIKYDLIPNPLRPGQMMAGNVEWIGREIAKQTSGGEVSRGR